RSTREFERITVVTPTYQASFYLRRTLAREGLFNVDFKRLEDIAEQLAGRDFDLPLLHDLQASEFVYEAARDPKLGTKLGGTDVSPQLQAALHSTFRELELLPRGQLERLRAKEDVQRELADRFDSYMQLADRYRRGAMVAEQAAKIVRNRTEPEAPDPRVGALGVVFLVKAAPVAPAQRPLFDALAGLANSVTVAISEETPGPNHKQLNLNPISVPDVAEEVRSVVRGIIKLARPTVEGKVKKFARMAVVFEDDNYAARIGEALELAGIPVSGPDRTALSDAPEGQFVTGLLDMFENDFTRLDLTAWLATAPVKDPKTGLAVPAARWDAVSRAAGITSSLEDSWIPRLDQYSAHRVARAERSERLNEGRANEIEAAKSDAEYALALSDFVAALADRRPTAEQDSWSGFGNWLRTMADDYLLIIDSTGTEARRARLFDLIDRLESLETPGKVPGYKHCAGVLREQLGRRSPGLRSLGSGVYVGPVWTAAACPFDTVFMLGMTEGRYPSAGTSDPLLPDPLKREIDGGGKYLKTVERSIEESKLSFDSVLSSAGQVFMYWPGGVPGESREFGPARWFLEAVRLVSGEPQLQAGQLSNLRLSTPGRAMPTIKGLTMHRRSDAATLPAAQAGDVREYDVLSARSWNLGDNAPAVFPLSPLIPSIAASVRFEVEQNGEKWSAYDGKVELPGARDESAPGETSETIGSATAFETYAACPYRYFLSRRLHVEPTDSPEPELALDPLSFGTLIHDVLESFSRWRMGHAGDPPAGPEQELWLREAVGNRIEVLREETPGRAEGAWQIERNRAWLILRQWLRREPTVAAHPEMRQVEAEYAFGTEQGGPAVVVRTVSGKNVRFRGQIDRVDISDDGLRVIVYDYKSGGNTGYSKLEDDPVKQGTRLQLPLYSMAVANKYPEADISASYWFVRESGNDELKPGPEIYDKDRAETALAAAVETIVDGIDNGVFPARPGEMKNYGDGGPSFENCRYCEYQRVCPRSKARLWDSKKRSDPALESYVDLAEGGP
ncbi:MAG: PD-(D/E)XK nuclease family protein, partial [Chloroflexi bacterium]|nr:PD-(D/E)XK nuclease family protein [Chloroflexota bacterium]